MLIVQRPTLRAIALGIASIFSNYPEPRLFGFLIPIPFIGGIGKRTAIVARSSTRFSHFAQHLVGLTGSILPSLEAAQAMGMTRRADSFSRPFSSCAGRHSCRHSHGTIITIGVELCCRRLAPRPWHVHLRGSSALVSDALILAGAIPAALLALLADFLLGLVERRLKVS